MNILLLNGSPREGNTKFAIKALEESIGQNMAEAVVTTIHVADKAINPCIGCDVCKTDGICVFDDDMAEFIDMVRRSDVIVFGSAVYWWGITAQLKAFIDRIYALTDEERRSKKKIGLIMIGQDQIEGPQYRIIGEQFDCICDYLGWEIVFSKSISADKPDDLKNNMAEIEALNKLWKTI